MNTSINRPVIVSLTAIPPRFENLMSKVNSLLNQSVPAKAIEIYIPRTYRRFPSVQARLPRLPKGVEVISVDNDLGPATKLLPAIDKWKGYDVDILICDDDRLQDPRWIERLASARRERPDDIICERGWNIADRFGLQQNTALLPRARHAPKQGRTLAYRMKRALTLGLYHPPRLVYEASGYVDVFEGFLGALIPPGALPHQAWSIPDILWTVDDVWLSGMARLQNVGVWAHDRRRPVQGNGHWDRVASLTGFKEQGVNRESADRLCVEYMRSNYKVWN